MESTARQEISLDISLCPCGSVGCHCRIHLELKQFGEWSLSYTHCKSWRGAPCRLRRRMFIKWWNVCRLCIQARDHCKTVIWAFNPLVCQCPLHLCILCILCRSVHLTQVPSYGWLWHMCKNIPDYLIIDRLSTYTTTYHMWKEIGLHYVLLRIITSENACCDKTGWQSSMDGVIGPCV